MRQTVLASAAALVAGASAQSYCDDSGRCFASHTNSAGVTYGFAIPETDAAPFGLVLQVTAPNEVGWAGVSMATRMTNAPLIVTWPNGEATEASPRVAFSYAVPVINEAATTRVLDSSVNGTHWVSTVFCEGCSSWADLIPTPPNALDPSTLNFLGLVYSTNPVDDPADPATNFGIHQGADINSIDFNLAQSADFDDWVGGGEEPEEPEPTPTVTATTATTGPTATATAPGESALPTVCGGLESRFPLEVAPGWAYAKIAGGLRTPRGLITDTLGNILLIQSGLGLTVHSVGADGCLSSSRTLIARQQLNHGVALTPDGTTLYVSSISTVWKYAYDPVTQTVSGETIVVSNMYPGSHSSRTLLVPPATPDLLVVSLGSHTNLDGPSVVKETGRAIVKVFDISTAPSGGYDYTSHDHYLGYGLRNEVALAADPNNMIWGVENSADDFVRLVDGVETPIVEENPAEELNYLGDPTVSNEQWYGYPTCFTVWGGDLFPDGDPTTGSQFIPAPNSTWTDATCEERSTPPRLAIKAHSAPLDSKFDADGSNLFVSLHGSWNREVPTGYKVVTIPFTEGANGFEPVAAADSTEGYDDILWDTQSGCNSSKCFRPCGLDFDQEFSRIYIGSDNSQEGELYVLYRTS